MKIVTRPADWMPTKNPFISTLRCPLCLEFGVVLQTATVLKDGPHGHVNLGDIQGAVLSIPGRCNSCETKLVWRATINEHGIYAWMDCLVSDHTFNDMLKGGSTEQLPCMCQKCQDEGKVKPVAEAEAPLPPPATKKVGHKCQTAVKPASPGPVKMEKVELDPSIIQSVAGKGRVLTDDQIKMLMKAGNMNIEEVMKRSGQSREQVISNYTAIVEAYVRIKFATFQPKQTDDPDVPPTFPIVIPPLMAELFNAQKDFPFMCQYLIAAYATVDTALSRPDLPASIVWHHMCPMCKVTDCIFHTTNRKEG